MKKYFKNTWETLRTCFIGLKITLLHCFRPAVTIQYPDVKPSLPERSRNRLYVKYPDCIGCMMCLRACPVSCIDIETLKSVPGDGVGTTTEGRKKALWVTKFDIDTAKCCLCGLCTYDCPTGAIRMTDIYEYTESYREDLIYHFSSLTEDEVVSRKAALEKFQAEKEAEKLRAKQDAEAAQNKNNENNREQ